MNDSDLLIQNVNRIASSLELTEDIQRRIIISLVQLASFSKSKNLLLKELYSYGCDADSIEPEINQMLAFSLLKESTLNCKVRLTLVRDLWKLKSDNVEAIVKAIKSIVNKNYELDFPQYRGKSKYPWGLQTHF